ncbi:MAG TPA: LLM class F420-dependent oxidoreductase [Anaerolineaceae bacterium]|nr:LLM class F420-dependent oxidoreductase [Anaerolineaceae bacterium]
MKIGLQIPSFTWQGGEAMIGRRLAEIAQTADGVGFDSIWVMDHFFQIRGVGQPEEPMLEGYSALNFIAAHTLKARLGTLVTGVIYRHPGMLVKSVTTLDVLSAGRAYLGIGAAWNEQESRGLGIPFPPIKERFERLEEALQIARQMWSGKVEQFTGKYYQLERTLNSPQPLSRPHPPILIGGGGERKTLRLVAKYADACNLFLRLGEEAMRHKLDVLKRHCDQVGRSYEEIEKTGLDTIQIAPGSMTPFQLVEKCRGLSENGFQHVIFNMPNVSEIEPLEIIGREAIPEIKAL